LRIFVLVFTPERTDWRYSGIFKILCPNKKGEVGEALLQCKI